MNKVALVIGHREEQPGAYSKEFGLSEYGINCFIVNILSDNLSIDHYIVYRETYETLPAKINELKPDYIISFHMNAYNGKASGSETLYYEGSSRGKLLAETIHKSLQCLGLPDRGIKAVRVEERGGLLLKETKAPCIIIEPCFIDNEKDMKAFFKHFDEYMLALTNAINALE